MGKIRIFLAEDHTIVRKGIRTLLESEENIEVVGEAADGREVLKKIEGLNPDVVLMDISMPQLNGLEATRQLKKAMPDVKVLVLTVHLNEEYIYHALRAGASGYLVKHVDVTELITAVNAVYRGESYLSPSVSKKVIDEYIRKAEENMGEDSLDYLTSREREVLQLIAEGHTNKEIGDLLSISVKTVEAHRANLMGKLDLHSTAELTRYAIRKGVIASG